MRVAEIWAGTMVGIVVVMMGLCGTIVIHLPLKQMPEKTFRLS